MKFGFHVPHFHIEMGEGDAAASGATGDIDGIDADALMGQIERGEPVETPTHTQSATTPSSQPATEPAQSGPTSPAAQAPEAQAAAADPMVDLVINGQPYKAPMSRVKQWAQQGRNYAQLVEKFEAERTQHQAQYKNYAEIDAYAQTPEGKAWWDQVQQAYQAQKGQTPATAQVPPEFQSKLDQLTEFQSKFEEQEALKALDAQVQDVRKQYPDLSWDTLDEEGRTLESQVYDHAHKNGIQSFKTAFIDLKHDQIVKYREDKARELAVKELQAQRKTGVIGVSNTPQRQPAQGPTKHASYDDAAEAIKRELGIA